MQNEKAISRATENGRNDRLDRVWADLHAFLQAMCAPIAEIPDKALNLKIDLALSEVRAVSACRALG